LKFWFWLVQIRSQKQGKITEVLRTQESEEGRERRPAGEKPRNETADQNDSQHRGSYALEQTPTFQQGHTGGDDFHRDLDWATKSAEAHLQPDLMAPSWQ
jgi:hypothetical protein